ncbi:adenylate/guanylate cyclase [Oscillatoria nigro-viridis PCC 7112]|uniref:Adenylate/guanylate cyclase n=1 Tax=Phormidium nigroviride PCC 7112 TaxID=179408 RepID=K9VLB9_9CYAN|nr:adenylate/guanylate cyclase domain-containing protein [Oscillatoria nigro-viridis]AFZ08893.1 adenylate/guanylate cyclase [Oscillatoria nigro-viridis PCC 7112]
MLEEQPSREQLLLEIERLRQQVEDLKEEKADLEILLETTAEHSDTVETELRSRAFEAVREGEIKLAQFLEAIPIGVLVLDSQGRPDYVNHAGQQLLGQGVLPLNALEDLSESYQIYIAGTETIYPFENLPIVRALRGENATAEDLEIHRPDKKIPLEIWGTPIFDEGRKVAFAIAVFQDVTERKQAEAERHLNLKKSLDAESDLTDAYGRFVPHQFLHLLGYESIIDVNLGDQVQQEMSVLFADIRDFTTLSETMTPQENFKFINAYLSRMEPAITRNNGFIDKYIGDAIMALFSDYADDAVKAGIAMLNILNDYNEHRQRVGYIPIQIGIGINSGSLMLGTVGGQSRMDSTVISDAVNLASRIEGLTKDYCVPLLISQQTLERLRNPADYAIRIVDKVQVKGKSKYVVVYEVFDADPPEILSAKLANLSVYNEAMLLCDRKEFREAGKLFEECLRTNPSDRVARIYLKRCRDWRSLLKGI